MRVSYQATLTFVSGSHTNLSALFINQITAYHNVETNIGLAPNSRHKVIDILGGIIADQYILYTKTRNYHWNVTGKDFPQYHKLFEAQYSALDEDIDAVAERIRY